MPVATAAATPLRAFDLDVVGVRRLSPTYLRVTLGGPALHDFDGCAALGTRDLRVKLMVPTPGHRLPDLSDLSPGWYRRWLAMEPATRGAMRTYTVREARVDRADPEIDLDFVLHGDGPASSWAAAVRPGDRATVLGPRVGVEGYGGIEWQPPLASPERPVRVLLAGDETAVPAVCSILETLPAGYHGHAVLEVPHADDFLDVRTAADVEIRWLARDGGPHGARLESSVRQVLGRPNTGPSSAPVPPAVELPDVDVDTELLWESAASGAAADGRAAAGDFYAWVAGEAAAVRALRRYLVRDLGVDRRSVAFMGYWRHGSSERV
jgi:NADPH-dependent ferric siderophore reductase